MRTVLVLAVACGLVVLLVLITHERASEHPVKDPDAGRAPQLVSPKATSPRAGGPTMPGSPRASTEHVERGLAPGLFPTAAPDAGIDYVQRQYDRLYDAGFGPHQVEVVQLPDGLVGIRMTVGDAGFDDEPIAPGVLNRWAFMHIDHRAMQVVDVMRDQASEHTAPCLRTIATKHGVEFWAFSYVWDVRSAGGVGRVRVEVLPQWWPAEIDAQDRACYLAAFRAIERTQFLTDTHEFAYRVEVQDQLPLEDGR